MITKVKERIPKKRTIKASPEYFDSILGLAIKGNESLNLNKEKVLSIDKEMGRIVVCNENPSLATCNSCSFHYNCTRKASR